MIKGVWYTTGAFLLWGVLPLYWRALIRIPSTQILAHRVFWSFAFVASLTIIQKRWKEVKYAFSSKRNRITFLSSSTALGINWFIYIWAVNAGHVVDTSLGYFINPLFSVFLGAVFLRERLKFWKMVAISLALSGVAYLTYQFGKIPWISLSLALSFGTYGLLRKTARVDSQCLFFLPSHSSTW
jgi:chloramphenicol-sensitive protein RarD